MVTEFGSTELVEAIAPGLIAGEQLASYCLTEPGAGSDAASLRTQAVVDGDDYVINGSKMFISGAGDTDYLVTMLRTGGPGPKGISCVVIPSGTEGIQFGHNLHKMGWNSQPTREIVFDNVRVPIGHRLGEEGDGFKIAMKGLDGGRINIGTCSVGTAQAALNRALLSAACAVPTEQVPMLMRPPSRPFIAILNPSPSSPRRCPMGTRTLSKTISRVG